MNIKAIPFLALTILAQPTAAHHGFRMDYDASTTYWLEGTIVEGYYGLPHAEFDLRLNAGAMPEAGDTDEKAADLIGRLERSPRDLRPVVEVEFPQQEQFYALGDVLKPGDAVAVIVMRGCDSPNPLRAQWIKLPDGSTLRAKGTVQAEVQVCERASGRD